MNEQLTLFDAGQPGGWIGPRPPTPAERKPTRSTPPIVTPRHSPPDLCAGRHRGNEQSRAAYRRGEETGAHSRDYWTALRLIHEAGDGGMTSKELAAAMEKPINAISGRRTELLADGLIREDGRRRDGCAVVVGVPGARRRPPAGVERGERDGGREARGER